MIVWIESETVSTEKLFELDWTINNFYYKLIWTRWIQKLLQPKTGLNLKLFQLVNDLIGIESETLSTQNWFELDWTGNFLKPKLIWTGLNQKLFQLETDLNWIEPETVSTKNWYELDKSGNFFNLKLI